MSKLIVSEIESTGTTVQINDDLKVGSTGTNAITSGNVVSPSEDMIKFFKAYETPVTAFDAAITGGVPGNTNAVPWEDPAPSGFTSTTALAVTSTGNSLLTNFSADAVFLYKSSGTANCKNDYWGITIDIPKVYRGQNIILNFDYRTENASTVETAADQWFIAVQDKTNTVKTTVTDTALVSAGAAVTVASKAGLVVGDKIWLEGGGNAQGSVSNGITQTYITSISGTANEITLSQDYTPASTAGSIAVVGYLSDTLDLLAAADSDTDKVGKNRKLAFKTAEDTAQVNVWFQLRNTDSVVYSLFMDNIYISANKFLQASSKGQAEWVQLSLPGNSGTTLGRGSTNTAIPYGRNEDYNSISKYGTFENSHTLGISFTASVKCVATMTYTQGGTSSMWAGISKNSNQLTTGVYSITASHRIASHYEGVANAPMVATATVPLEPGDVLRPHAEAVAIGDYPYNFDFFMSVEPEVNDVIILESQDEIFTDWTDYSSELSTVGPANATNTGTDGTYATVIRNSARWRRVAGEMEVEYSFRQSGYGTTSTGIVCVPLPSGYSIDPGKIWSDGIGTTIQGQRVGSLTFSNNPDGVSGANCPGFFYANTDDLTTGVFWANQGSTTYLFGYLDYTVSFDNCSTLYGSFQVPISGWNANFNPLLSMPLVNIGSNVEQYLNNGWTGRAGVSSKSLYTTNTPTINTINNLGTIINSNGSTTSDGFGFTASQRVKVDMAFGNMSTGYEYVAIVKNASAVDPVATAADGNKIITGKHEANQIGSLTGSVILDPGETIWACVQPNGSLYTNNYAGSISLTVEKDFSNTNMAHIIKPAVAILKEVQASTVSGGSNVASSVWTARTLNTIEGESWFVTLSGTSGFILEKGTYEISWSTPLYKTEAFASRLYDSTNSVEAAVGSCGYNSVTQINSVGNATVTIGSTTTYQIQYTTLVQEVTHGLGYYNYYQSASTSVYTQVKIRKLK